MRKKLDIVNDILFDKTNNYIKRLVTLMITFHFVLSSFLFLIVYPVILFSASRGDIEVIKVITGAFLTILEYDFWIIAVGFGFLTTKDFATAMIEKAKAKAGMVSDSSFTDTSTTTTLLD